MLTGLTALTKQMMWE